MVHAWRWGYGFSRGFIGVVGRGSMPTHGAAIGPRQVCRGDCPAQIARRVRKDRVRHGQERLQRNQPGIAARGVAAHADGQPGGVADEDGPEVKVGAEQPVGHAEGQSGDGAADLAAPTGRIGQGELEIIKPIGRAAAAAQLALIGERRALGRCG